MLYIIKAMLNLWDPYGIYCFPDDEYESEAIKIEEFITHNENINEDALVNYIFNILPPLNLNEINSNVNELLKLEYSRFVKLLLLILNYKN